MEPILLPSKTTKYHKLMTRVRCALKTMQLTQKKKRIQQMEYNKKNNQTNHTY